MNDAVARAFADVQNAFFYRPRPRDIPHCGMCYQADEINAFLAMPDEV